MTTDLAEQGRLLPWRRPRRVPMPPTQPVLRWRGQGLDVPRGLALRAGHSRRAWRGPCLARCGRRTWSTSTRSTCSYGHGGGVPRAAPGGALHHPAHGTLDPLPPAAPAGRQGGLRRAARAPEHCRRGGRSTTRPSSRRSMPARPGWTGRRSSRAWDRRRRVSSAAPPRDVPAGAPRLADRMLIAFHGRITPKKGLGPADPRAGRPADQASRASLRHRGERRPWLQASVERLIRKS